MSPKKVKIVIKNMKAFDIQVAIVYFAFVLFGLI